MIKSCSYLIIHWLWFLFHAYVTFFFINLLYYFLFIVSLPLRHYFLRPRVQTKFKRFYSARHTIKSKFLICDAFIFTSNWFYIIWTYSFLSCTSSLFYVYSSIKILFCRIHSRIHKLIWFRLLFLLYYTRVKHPTCTCMGTHFGINSCLILQHLIVCSFCV